MMKVSLFFGLFVVTTAVCSLRLRRRRHRAKKLAHWSSIAHLNAATWVTTSQILTKQSTKHWTWIVVTTHREEIRYSRAILILFVFQYSRPIIIVAQLMSTIQHWLVSLYQVSMLLQMQKQQRQVKFSRRDARSCCTGSGSAANHGPSKSRGSWKTRKERFSKLSRKSYSHTCWAARYRSIWIAG